ncbi:hypothetical protein ACUNV4_17255 [Granulosicoccus sp. 3-233]|uniref:hypothetical protein n=1 Tax=Granulosicoccus sp. 3-233 TaxID=3417969 RepID=UPI003D341126
MNAVRSVARVLVLSLLAGTACSASDKLPQEDVMPAEIGQQTLQAGIELATAAGEGPPPIVFHVSNHASQAVDILTWNTPLEKELSADVFVVVRDGKTMEYLGRMVKRGSPQPHDYVTVPAGGRVDATVDIGQYYDMSEPGDYSISYRPYLVDGLMQLNQETPIAMKKATLSFTIKE